MRIDKILAKERLLLFLLFVLLFVLALHPIIDFDTFFGLKIGELIAKTGQIPSHEVFSWSANGREIIPYEWLSQVWVFGLNQLGGFGAIEAYVALMLSSFSLIAYFLFRKIFGFSLIAASVLSISLYASIYEFFVSRPQIIAFVAFSAVLYLILQFILKRRDWLILTLPITYIWVNSHASFIFAPYLLFSYAFFSFWYFKKDPEFAKFVSRRLFIFGLLNIAVTFFPPLYFKPYVLLWQFLTDLNFMTKFVSEWGSLSSDFAHQIFYFAFFSFFLILALIFSVKTKKWSNWLLSFPLIFISVFSFQAIRHLPFGITAVFFALPFFIPKTIRLGKGGIVIFLTLLILSAWLIDQKRESMWDANWNFPQKSIEFLKTHELKGRMFNEFAVGGYLIYYLYPQYQVFFDGRADIYHCCEMRDFWPLIVDKSISKDQFKKDLRKFLDKYNFSFVLVPPNSYNPLEFTASGLMADVLLDDSNWRLVYFSDRMQILVKNDGKNEQIFQSMGSDAATPYRLNPYKKGARDKALLEYKRMISISDSGIARSGLGFILLAKGEFKEAKINFDKATLLNENIGNPFLGLGTIEMKQGNKDKAIIDFKKAIDISPFLGEAYFVLGQAYVSEGKPSLAQKAWDDGLNNNIDFISRQKIIEAENNL